MKNPNFMPFTSLTQADAPLATRRFGEEAPPAAALPEEAAAAGTRVGDLLASPALEAEAAAGAGAFLAAAGAVLRLAATVACGEPCWIVVVFVWGGGVIWVGWLRERGVEKREREQERRKKGGRRAGSTSCVSFFGCSPSKKNPCAPSPEKKRETR